MNQDEPNQSGSNRQKRSPEESLLEEIEIGGS